MRLQTLVWKELWQRPAAMLTSGLAIFLAVAALVAIRHVTVHSERQVAEQLSSLGANLLILPKNATLQDYYGADLNGQTLPEEHVSSVLLAGLAGVERIAPKLCVPAKIGTEPVTLTGILPQDEFQVMAQWQSVALFSNKHVGCKKASCAPTAEDMTPESLGTRRTIENLRDDQVLLGADVAARSGLSPGRTVDLLKEKFEVLAVLAPSGTVDDSRVFAHLHTVQRLAGTGEVVNAIEVMACCEDAAGDLVARLGDLLPDTKVVTISQVVETQVSVNRLMSNTSWFVFLVLALIGSASLAGTISSNVRERRREIGTLMALGATPGFVLRLFLMKALWLGIAGGLAGCAFGVALAIWFGPRWAGVSVEPLVGLSASAIGAASVLAIVSALWPARRAAQLDPCLCFQEI